MPFTPLHFGPHALVGLSFEKRLDLPVFLGANIAVDLEPLMVMSLGLPYPLHGIFHTFPVGGLAGLVFATLCFPFRGHLNRLMKYLRLPYATSYTKMAVSGILGAWLHILFDSVMYYDITPFYPFQANPLLGLLSPFAVRAVCAACFIPALILYVVLAFFRRTDK